VSEQPTPITPVEDVRARVQDLRAIVLASTSRALPEPLLDSALERTASFAAAVGQPVQDAGAGYVAEILAATWLDPGWTRRSLERLFLRVAAALDVPPSAARASLLVRAVRDGSLFELPPRVAIEAQLQMLPATAGASSRCSRWASHRAGAHDRSPRRRSRRTRS
jgi:hypothetical protein